MANAVLYYGNGEATLEGTGIRGIQLKYSGNIKVEKTANDNFVMVHNKNGIIIFPIGDGYLNELFHYSGTFRITSLIVADNNAEVIPSTVKRVMDYSELINSTAETMTNKAEELSSSYSSSRIINESNQILENQHTRDKSTPFFLKNKILYEGYYHIHLKDASCMTGATHDKNSQDLYFKQIKDGVVVNNLLPTRNPKVSSINKLTRWGTKGAKERAKLRHSRK